MTIPHLNNDCCSLCHVRHSASKCLSRLKPLLFIYWVSICYKLFSTQLCFLKYLIQNFWAVKSTQVIAFQTCSVESFQLNIRLYLCKNEYEIWQ